MFGGLIFIAYQLINKMFENLIKIAEEFDLNGLYNEADQVDRGMKLQYHKLKPPTAQATGQVAKNVEKFLNKHNLMLMRIRDYYPIHGGVDCLVKSTKGRSPDFQVSKDNIASFREGSPFYVSVFFNNSNNIDDFTLFKPSDENHMLNKLSDADFSNNFAKKHEIPPDQGIKWWEYENKPNTDKPPFDL